MQCTYSNPVRVAFRLPVNKSQLAARHGISSLVSSSVPKANRNTLIKQKELTLPFNSIRDT